jgi:hypothetical protein
MAEREGFEPSIRCRIHTFQACSFNRSDTSPVLLLIAATLPNPLPEEGEGEVNGTELTFNILICCLLLYQPEIRARKGKPDAMVIQTL